MQARVGLPELMTTPVAVQIAVCAHVDQHVETILAAAKSAQQVVPQIPRLYRNVQHFGFARTAPFTDRIVNRPERVIAHRIEQARGDLAEHVVRPDQIDPADGKVRNRKILRAPKNQVRARLPEVFVRFRVARQSRRDRLRVPFVPDAVRRRGARLSHLIAELTNLGKLRYPQTLDLLFEGPDTGDLPDASRNSPEQEVAGDIERACGEVAFVHLRLHCVRAGKLLRQQSLHQGVDFRVCLKKVIARRLVKGRGLARQLRGRDESGFGKILITRRPRLAIPQRFVFDLSCRQFADAFETEHGVAEVGDGLMPVLEVKAFEELLRIVRPDPVHRLPDGIG